tara:strand:+ start:1095 stop:2426 length:1332 start_codon:yes stop_codon:yes gene_type:complete
MLPKFYYINLNNCKDRKEHMKNFFRKLENKTKLSCKYQRIEALDAKNVDISEYSNLTLDEMWNFRDSNKKAVPGEFGCIYSHIKSMNTFINDTDNKDDYAFICEDDLDLFKININFFVEMINKIKDHVLKNDLLSLSCVGSPIIISQIADKIQQPVFLDYNSNKGGLYGTGCYIISRKLAKEIVYKYWNNNKFIIPKDHLSIAADHFLYPLSSTSSFMVPSLFTIKIENDSIIHSEHVMMQENVQKMMFSIWKKLNLAIEKKVSIISNNDWGKKYFDNNNIDVNTPTTSTYFPPNDYILFLENFDECIEKTPTIKEKSNTCYPVGQINLKDNKVVNIHFTQERDWSTALQNWENRKRKLPKKSDILFKFCDREFKGKFTEDLLKRFLDCDLSKKVAFISEYFKYEDIDLSKNKVIRTVPISLSDQDKKSSPNGSRLYQICGTI